VLYGGATGTPCSGLVLLRNIAAKREGLTDRLYGITAGALPTSWCPDDPGEGTTCWPAPESTANMNTSKVGRLGLSDAEEDAIVSFMQPLTVGFMPANQQ
jgi:hypothetical protein